jgi:putative GTP pyrophosphokinase
MDDNNKRDLLEKAVGFFKKYGKELHQIKDLLDIRLNQLTLAYTTENKLPCESITVKTRIKSLGSFLKKTDKINSSKFHFPSDIIHDLIGARVTCWFLDDCKGVANYILNSNFISVEPDAIYDYIQKPRESGYRSIHMHAHISYDRLSTAKTKVEIIPEKVICEIQIRTKLMDTWADLTHEFHYKAKEMGIQDPHLEAFLQSQASRLFTEDESFVAIRKVYQKIIEKSEKNPLDAD